MKIKYEYGDGANQKPYVEIEVEGYNDVQARYILDTLMKLTNMMKDGDQ